MIRRTSFAARAGLLLFGLLAGLAAVEAALRAGGWGFRAWQELRNERSLRRKASCVILCLGESTTDAGGKDSYPDQLEKILNRRLPAVKFTVLNKALPGLTSHAILSELEGYLAEYKPDIVTAMMGINDVRLGNAGGPRGPAPSRWRLAKLWSHVRESFAARRLARAPGPPPQAVPARDLTAEELRRQALAHIERRRWSAAEEAYLRAVELEPLSEENRFALGQLYLVQGKGAQAQAALEEAVRLRPDSSRAWGELARLHMERGRKSDAVEAVRRAVQADPRSYEALVRQGEVLSELGRLAEAEKSFLGAIAVDPDKTAAYLQMGRLSPRRGRMPEAEAWYLKALKADPDDPMPYINLGAVYTSQGRHADAENIYRLHAEREQQNQRAHLRWAQAPLLRGEYAAAEQVLRRSLARFPDFDRLLDALALCRQMQGDPAEADRLRKAAAAVRRERPNPETMRNHRALQRVLYERGVPLVSVQYAGRERGSLEALYDSTAGVLFVDSERAFREALEEKGPGALFYDLFGGGFGHATPEGNRLIAESLADALLRNFFDDFVESKS